MNDSNISDEVTAKPPARVFIVRIWAEVFDQGMVIWRGKVQHVPNGAWRYSQDWAALTAFLQNQVEEVVLETRQRVQHDP